MVSHLGAEKEEAHQPGQREALLQTSGPASGFHAADGLPRRFRGPLTEVGRSGGLFVD